ncbi:MAG: diaminopimelate epimerase, partial [Myxococcota bacterium]
SPLDPAVAARLCDRRFGVGADGILAILAPRHPEALARMAIRNADGSEPEMCGNGIRCVAKWLFDRGLRRAASAHPTGCKVIPIETGAGVLDCGIETGADGRAETVAVEMGKPLVLAERRPLEVAGRSIVVSEVSMGNPHAVAFVDDASVDLRALAETIGPAVERHARYPARTNAEFARVAAGAIELVVWERGCGITLACGTGASATAAAAVATGRLPAGREIEVRLPGGSLFIRVAEGLAGVRMRGPAVEVYQGELPAI